MKLRPFSDSDIWRIQPQPSQAMGEAERWRILRESVPRGPCWTFLSSDGRVLAIGGFVRLHAGWLTAWTILAADIGAGMVGLTRAVARMLAQVAGDPDVARVDMHVDPENVASVLWAQMLGFRLDAILPRALPGGRDMGVWSYERKAQWLIR